LLEAFEVHSPTKQTQPRCCNYIEAPNTTSTALISISDDNLDKVISLSTKTSEHTQSGNIKCIAKQKRGGQHQYDTGFRSTNDTKLLRRTDQIPVQLPALQDPAKIERTLRDNAESQARLWGKEYGVEDAKPPTPSSSARKHFPATPIRSTDAWEGFAVQHGAQGRSKPQVRQISLAVNAFQDTSTTVQELRRKTGGYCLDPNRDYTRPDKEVRGRQCRQSKGRSNNRIVRAKFIPCTQNSPAEQLKSSFRNGAPYVEQWY